MRTSNRVLDQIPDPGRTQDPIQDQIRDLIPVRTPDQIRVPARRSTFLDFLGRALASDPDLV
jgi:hypothetical protein